MQKISSNSYSRKKKVIFVVSNPVHPDPRVQKEAASLSKSGKYLVSIFCWDREKKSPRNEISDLYTITRFRLKAPYGTFSLAPFLVIWQFAIFLKLLTSKFDIIHACNFDSVIPCYIAAKIKRKKIIYDIFDYYADTLPINKMGSFYAAIKFSDTFFINQCDAIILPDECRLNQISPAKPKIVSFIYNTPEKIVNNSTQEFKQESNFEIFYAGILPKNRGIDEIIEVSETIKNLRFILAGFGEQENYFKKICSNKSHTKFLGKITHDEVLKRERCSSMLIATYDPNTPNHRYSSPNKLFEAMMLGKPIIVARGTSMDKIVQKENMGIIVPYGDTNELRSQIEKIMSQPETYKQFCINAKNAYQKYSWETMETRLLNLYDGLIPQEATA